MIILVMSEPHGELADSLLRSGVSTLICATQGDVHVRTETEGVVSGKNINLKKKIEINVPEIKSYLLKSYPLIDRWVSKRQSVSTTVGALLEYTVSLIQVIGNNPPCVAVLETGAPHHLFTYCLDVALNYLGIKIYYLYGNAFDGRCLVVEGNKKISCFAVTDYSAEKAIREYVNRIQSAASYTPEDSIKSLAPLRHKSFGYAIYLHLRTMLSKYRRGRLDTRGKGTEISLKFPSIKLLELIGILSEHRRYVALLEKCNHFHPGGIRENDVVYVGHMVPEATSFPESPDYPDEIDLLIDLKNRFPESKIYYREHPAIGIFSEFGQIHLQGLHKTPLFFEKLEALGIGIIPATIHISKIRESGCLFATKTGRVAVENSVLGLSTIIYGYPFYGTKLPLSIHVTSLPASATVQSVKNIAAIVSDPALAVNAYLVTMFSGTIENPGISLPDNPSARPAFETDFVRLVGRLALEN